MSEHLIVVCKDAATPYGGDRYAVGTPPAFDAHFGRGEQLLALTMRDSYSEASDAARKLDA